MASQSLTVSSLLLFSISTFLGPGPLYLPTQILSPLNISSPSSVSTHLNVSAISDIDLIPWAATETNPNAQARDTASI